MLDRERRRGRTGELQKAQISVYGESQGRTRCLHCRLRLGVVYGTGGLQEYQVPLRERILIIPHRSLEPTWNDRFGLDRYLCKCHCKTFDGNNKSKATSNGNQSTCLPLCLFYLSILLCFFETTIWWNIRAISINPASSAATAPSAAP